MGVSFGLGYPSGRAISKREITSVFKELKKYSAVYSFHLRDESISFLNSLKEVVEVAQEHQANTLISHLKTQGKNNFEDFETGIKLINQANQEKDPFIHFDIYPYDYICQSLYNLLPD